MNSNYNNITRSSIEHARTVLFALVAFFATFTASALTPQEHLQAMSDGLNAGTTKLSHKGTPLAPTDERYIAVKAVYAWAAGGVEPTAEQKQNASAHVADLAKKLDARISDPAFILAEARRFADGDTIEVKAELTAARAAVKMVQDKLALPAATTPVTTPQQPASPVVQPQVAPPPATPTPAVVTPPAPAPVPAATPVAQPAPVVEKAKPAGKATSKPLGAKADTGIVVPVKPPTP